MSVHGYLYATVCMDVHADGMTGSASHGQAGNDYYIIVSHCGPSQYGPRQYGQPLPTSGHRACRCSLAPPPAPPGHSPGLEAATKLMCLPYFAAACIHSHAVLLYWLSLGASTWAVQSMGSTAWMSQRSGVPHALLAPAGTVVTQGALPV